MAKCNKLFTKTAFAKVPALYATENVKAENKVAFVKIFSILSDHRHYVIEYDPETGEAFVLTTNQDVCELGYISIPEMQNMNDNFRAADPNRPGRPRARWIMPPWERELHASTEGYSIASVQEAHSRQYNPTAWKASAEDGKAEVIPV